MIGGERMAGLVEGLASVAARDREEACETVTDWLRSFSASEVSLLTVLLASRIVVERDRDCRESEFHALCELLDSGLVDPADLSALSQFDSSSLWSDEREYYEYLTGYAADAGGTYRGGEPRVRLPGGDGGCVGGQAPGTE
ncbi:hypothetical protein [Streptomyces sp. NPDC003077]|uniref:hypothetical protein n=1 Tax=Streptomyces sp. NPDC003077 TaxID=3154443 RepID=UPI00339FA5F9